jgi:uncharacterized protein (DUF488 family)
MVVKRIWTIGHSTRSIEEFISLLHGFKITLLADVRNFPGSRRYPHFNKESLEASLKKENISYIHYKDLGGRRKPVPGSVNTAWRHEAFRGYADYMQTEEFQTALADLKSQAIKQHTAYMCSEAVWWRCHRSLISDQLKSEGWTVMHIMEAGKEKEHPYTAPAKIINGKLSYSDSGLF